MLITYHDIADIAKYRSDKGAITFYIYSSINETGDEFKGRFNSLVHSMKKAAERFENNSKDLSMMTHAIDNNRDKIIDRFVGNKAQTFCVFLARDFYKFVELPIRVKERTVVDYEFYTLPLLTLLEQFERYAILVFNRRKACLYHYYLTEMREEETVFHDYLLPKFNVSTDSRKSTKEKKVNHMVEESFHRHLKEVSGILFDNFKNLGFDKLILGSHQDEINSIKGHLHSYLVSRLVGEFTADVEDTIKIIKEKTNQVISEYRRNKEEKKVANLLSSNAHKKAVLGTEAVLDAIMAGNVRGLVLANDFHAEGYTCPEGHFATMTPTQNKKCIFCDKLLQKHLFLEDEIIEDVFHQRAEVFHLFNQKAKLNNYKIGVFLRF